MKFCEFCGEPLIDVVNRQKYHIECSEKVKQKRNADFQRKTRSLNKLEVVAKEAKCPRCGIIHKDIGYYTGKAKLPLIACKNCKDAFLKHSDMVEFPVLIGKRDEAKHYNET